MNGQVNALAVGDSGYLYATGLFDSAGGVKAHNIARWNGNVWSALGSGIGGTSLAIDDSGNVFACDIEQVFRWTDTKWDTLGGVGMNSSIYAVAIDKSNNICIGGAFNPDPGFWNCVDIVKDRTSTSLCSVAWGAIASPPGVSTMGFDSYGNLYAGGYFFNACGVAASCIARWDGRAWSALGSGVAIGGNGSGITQTRIDAIVADNSGKLYVGGSFQYAGGKADSNIGICNIKGTSADNSTAGNFRKSAKPAVISGNLHFTLFQPSKGLLRIFDITGKEVFRNNSLLFGAGSHVLRIPTNNLHSGVYVLDFQAGEISYRDRLHIMK